MKESSSSNILSMFLISSRFDCISDDLVMNRCSSFLYRLYEKVSKIYRYFSNSNLISAFLSSSFF